MIDADCAAVSFRVAGGGWAKKARLVASLHHRAPEGRHHVREAADLGDGRHLDRDGDDVQLRLLHGLAVLDAALHGHVVVERVAVVVGAAHDGGRVAEDKVEGPDVRGDGDGHLQVVRAVRRRVEADRAPQALVLRPPARRVAGMRDRGGRPKSAELRTPKERPPRHQAAAAKGARAAEPQGLRAPVVPAAHVHLRTVLEDGAVRVVPDDGNLPGHELRGDGVHDLGLLLREHDGAGGLGLGAALLEALLRGRRGEEEGREEG